MSKVTTAELDGALATEYVSRNEIWKAFKVCKDWINANRGGVSTPSRSAPQAAPAPAPAANTTSVEGIIGILDDLSGSFGEASATLRDRQTESASNLAEILSQKEEVTARLKKLFKITTAGDKAKPFAQILESLINQYETNEEKHTATSQEAQQDLNTTLEQKNAALVAEDDAWKKAYKLKVADRNNEWKREAALFTENYNLAVNRENDEFATLQEGYTTEISDLSTTARNGWNTTENELRVREIEYRGLKASVEEFDERLSSAKERGAGMGRGIANGNNSKDSRTTQANTSAESNIRTRKIIALTSKRDGLLAAVISAETERRAAGTRFQELSTTIVQASSNQAALDAVTQLASEQASGSKRR